MNIFFYKIVLSYDGSGYYGWQKQKGNIVTIQGELEKALKKISKNNQFKTIGSGRTDAKVHAKGQVARIEFPFFIPAKSFKNALNSLINKTIYIIKCEEVDQNFHPIFSAVSKEYRYYFSLKELSYPWLKNYISTIKGNYNITLMNDVAKMYIGEHNFKNFYTVGTPVKSTIRTILDCKVSLCHTEIKLPFLSNEDQIYEFKIIGSGFMKQMVRLLVGTMFNIASNKILKRELSIALNGELDDKKKLGAVVPANGLYLYEVNY